MLRQAWELLHNILGIALFVFGVWQMYEGMELYHQRYDNASFATAVVFYFLWMAFWLCIIVGAIVYKWFFLKHDGSSVSIDGAASVQNGAVELPVQVAENSSEIS